jgi:hypothetical protein
MDTPSSAYAATNAAVYAHDFYAWCLTTAELVRSGQWDAIDPEALVEELESLGKSQKRELENRVEGLVMHLLKWQSQPSRRVDSHSWYDTIRGHRNEIARLLRDSPSLKPQVSPLLDDLYPQARAWALGEMTSYTHETQLRQILHQDPLTQERALSRAMETFHFSFPPLQCPWTEEQILDTDFWPGS